MAHMCSRRALYYLIHVFFYNDVAHAKCFDQLCCLGTGGPLTLFHHAHTLVICDVLICVYDLYIIHL